MTTTSIIAYLMMPVGGVLVGLAVYWLTAGPQPSRPPAE